MVLVELFSKEDCHLCQEARTLLEKVRREIPFDLMEEKLVPGHPLYERFHDKVPVVFINHEEVFHFRVDEHTLREKLKKVRE